MRISSDRISEFVETVDDMFGAYETLYDEDTKVEENNAVGVGVFYFEERWSDSAIF